MVCEHAHGGALEAATGEARGHLWGEGGAVVSICMRESAHRAEGRTERIRSRSRSAIAGVGALSRARERYCGRTERIGSCSRSAIAGAKASNCVGCTLPRASSDPLRTDRIGSSSRFAIAAACNPSSPGPSLPVGKGGGRRGERMHAIRAARAELTGSPKRRRAPYAVVAVLDARDNLLNGGGTSL